jgi:DNA-binding NarL/FixJ family response regulator
MSIRVLLADDHRMFREGLRSLLAGQRDFEIVGETGDGLEAVALARRLAARVVVMDVEMPLLNGIEATRQIRAELPGVRVVILSMYADRRFVAEALRAGATGYLLKDCAFEELAHAVRAAAAGQVYLSAAITGVVVEDYVRRAPDAGGTAFTLLTARERQILQLLAEGKGTRETAQLLEISSKTVESHRTHIMDKLGMYSIAELTRYAVREGLTRG